MFIVTGGAGFIGSVVLEALEKHYEGEKLVVVDWLEEGDKWKNIAKRTLHDVIFPEDTFEYLEAHAKEVKAIIHMGAISTTTETDGDAIVEQNIRYTLDLFRWCAEHKKRLIYASSAATYGDGSHGFEDKEDMAYLKGIFPMNGYGFSKHMIDKAIIATEEKHPPQWVGLKFFNVYGPNEYHKGGQKSVVAHAFNQITETGKMKLFKSYLKEYRDGEQVRDFVYIKDVARAILFFLGKEDVSGLFNIGTGQARTFNDLVAATFKAMGKKEKIEYIEMPDNIKNQYQYHTEANMEKFFEAYEGTSGEKPFGESFTFSSLEEGVEDYVQNHLMQEDPYL